MPKDINRSFPIIEFTVEGGRLCAFPMNMLRYDCCWPSNAEDADAISVAARSGFPNEDLVNIKLSTREPFKPSRKEWARWGWRVLD